MLFLIPLSVLYKTFGPIKRIYNYLPAVFFDYFQSAFCRLTEKINVSFFTDFRFFSYGLPAVCILQLHITTKIRDNPHLVANGTFSAVNVKTMFQ